MPNIQHLNSDGSRVVEPSETVHESRNTTDAHAPVVHSLPPSTYISLESLFNNSTSPNSTVSSLNTSITQTTSSLPTTTSTLSPSQSSKQPIFIKNEHKNKIVNKNENKNVFIPTLKMNLIPSLPLFNRHSVMTDEYIHINMH
jgi:hypothetical protein